MRRPQWTIPVLAVALLTAAVVVPRVLSVAHAASAQATSAPAVVPALQQWTPATGTFSLTGTSRVVTDSGSAGQLATTSAVFSADLRSLSGFAVATVTGGAADVRTGDVYLTLGSTDTGLGAEGYRLTVGASMMIQARGDAGVFNGSRTVLQLLSRTLSAPAGTARDWPSTPQRGLMVDNGRKYYSTMWLRNEIRQLAYLKYNVLHLHVSDDQGFRLESTVHPEIVSAQHYTKAQLADVVAFAGRYHMTIVPEIDMPSHMDAILASHPDLRLVGSDGTVNRGKLDLSKPAARQLASDLVTEYLPLFPGPVWHVGADEYLNSTQYANYPQLLSYAQTTYGSGATGQDAFIGFVNTVDSRVRAAGKTLRMWDDGIFGTRNVTLNADVQVDYWANNGATASQLRAAGHQLMNSNDGYLYYVLGRDWKPNPATIYAGGFASNLFQDGSTVPVGDPSFLGTSLSIWGDVPSAETELQVAADVLPSEQALAQVAWGSPKPTTDYTGFQAVAAAIGPAPGQEGASRGTPLTDLANYQTYWPSTMVDGNTGTWFWSNGAPVPGNYVGIDLGAVRPVSAVRVQMAGSSRPNDYLHSAVLEYSRDATTWTALGTFANQPDVQANPAGAVNARYVRLRSTGSQTNWLIVDEFTVSIRPSAAALTNLPAYQTFLPAGLVDGDATTWFWSNGPPPVDGYAGVDLGTVRAIGPVDVLMANGTSPNDYVHAGVLESSVDGATWSTLATFSGHNEVTATPPAGTVARYVRVRNTASQSFWLVLDEILVA
jgi:hexosaminidase